MKRFNATRLPIVLGALSMSLLMQGCFSAQCGNGIVDNSESCDDGNTDPNDFCNNECAVGPLIALEGFVQKEVDSTDVLLVVDNSGSMAEEHINFMAQLENIIADLDSAGKPLRFATITSDADTNPQGNFFTTPDDIKLGNGSIVRDIPNEFCDAVISTSNGGVLASNNPDLQNLLATHPPIPDFTGRLGGFVDLNNDKISDNLVQPTYIDAVGCLLAVGIRGSGQEVALCQAAASLDEASLSTTNQGFLKDPNSVLGIVVISDEDDCTISVTEQNGEFICHPLDISSTSAQGLTCTQSINEDICGTGVHGERENLTPTSVFVDRIKALRDEDHTYVATLSGPPGENIADCENNFPVPVCNNNTTGSASPGNRYFEFVNQFVNRSDAFENSICGEPVDAFSVVKKTLVKTVDFDCLDTNIDAAFGGIANFNVARNMKVKLDLSRTSATCESLSAIATTDGADCLLTPEAISLNAKQSCGGGFELTTDNLGLPNGTHVTVEFRK